MFSLVGSNYSKYKLEVHCVEKDTFLVHYLCTSNMIKVSPCIVQISCY